MVLTFSAYWVGLMVPCWRLILSARIAGCALVDRSLRASENFSRVAGSLSLDEWNWVRGGSSGSMAVASGAWAADFDKRERCRTIGLWSVGGPGCDLRVHGGLLGCDLWVDLVVIWGYRGRGGGLLGCDLWVDLVVIWGYRGRGGGLLGCDLWVDLVVIWGYMLKFQVFSISVQNCHPTLCWCCLLLRFGTPATARIIPPAVNNFFRTESCWQVMFCQNNDRHTFSDRQAQNIFLFLLRESVDIYSNTLEIYMRGKTRGGLEVRWQMCWRQFLFLTTGGVWRVVRATCFSGWC